SAQRSLKPAPHKPRILGMNSYSSMLLECANLQQRKTMTLPDQARHAPASMDGNPTIDERASYCFGCGPANPQGLHLVFTTDSNPEATTATAHLKLDRLHEGPPGHIHGGIVATLLDEAMSKLNRPLDVIAMTRHMEIDYLRPAPLYQPLVLIGRHLSRPA